MVLGSSPAEKKRWVTGGSELNMIQQCAVAAKVADNIGAVLERARPVD